MCDFLLFAIQQTGLLMGNQIVQPYDWPPEPVGQSNQQAQQPLQQEEESTDVIS